jgi:hypothetical protein
MNYTFTLLSSSDSIGDTLSAINQNYNNLENWITNIQLSADNFWKPFAEFYKGFTLELKPNIKKSNDLLGNWKSVSSTVETNSAKWIEPLIFYYPYIINTSEQATNSNSGVISTTITQTKLIEITRWLNANFPVIENNIISYVENQELVLHLFLKSVRLDDDKYQISDSTVCSTSDTIASGPCTITLTGTVTDCNKSNYNCGGSHSCTVSQKVVCAFPNGAKNNNRNITANLNYSFRDEYEQDEILRLVFAVSNCSWIYKSKL